MKFKIKIKVSNAVFNSTKTEAYSQFEASSMSLTTLASADSILRCWLKHIIALVFFHIKINKFKKNGWKTTLSKIWDRKRVGDWVVIGKLEEIKFS